MCTYGRLRNPITIQFSGSKVGCSRQEEFQFRVGGYIVKQIIMSQSIFIYIYIYTGCVKLMKGGLTLPKMVSFENGLPCQHTATAISDQAFHHG